MIAFFCSQKQALNNWCFYSDQRRTGFLKTLCTDRKEKGSMRGLEVYFSDCSDGKRFKKFRTLRQILLGFHSGCLVFLLWPLGPEFLK